MPAVALTAEDLDRVQRRDKLHRILPVQIARHGLLPPKEHQEAWLDIMAPQPTFRTPEDALFAIFSGPDKPRLFLA